MIIQTIEPCTDYPLGNLIYLLENKIMTLKEINYLLLHLQQPIIMITLTTIQIEENKVDTRILPNFINSDNNTKFENN